MSGELKINNVVKSYGDKNVINSISFGATKGEFVVLVGPSGCGKSTMLRCIAGLETINSGSITIDGNEVSDKAPKDRDIAMVFQDYALYPHKDVYENIAFGLRMRKEPEAQIDRKVRAAAAKLDLTELLQRKPAAMSGGQRQRVAIGRAIVRDPKVFLFDEPLSNLDAKLRGDMRVTISRLHRELEATAVYVTHDQVEAMTLADKIIVLNGGKIQQMGTPVKLYYHPNNIFVATFIGSPTMNLIRGTVDAQLMFTSENNLKFQIPERFKENLSAHELAGKKLIWGMRTENLKISKEDQQGQKYAASVEVVELMGPQTSAHCIIEGHAVNVMLPTNAGVKVGDQLDLVFSSSHLYLFDETSGVSILDA